MIERICPKCRVPMNGDKCIKPNCGCATKMPKKGEHSREAKELVTEIIARLEDIPDGCAECFPFELIDELKQEYLTDNSL